MKQITRRESFLAGLAGLIPFGWGKTEKEPTSTPLDGILRSHQDALANYRQAINELIDARDYWRERCLAAEGDLLRREKLLILFHRQYQLALGEQPHSWKREPYTHPDCLSDRGDAA